MSRRVDLWKFARSVRQVPSYLVSLHCDVLVVGVLFPAHYARIFMKRLVNYITAVRASWTVLPKQASSIEVAPAWAQHLVTKECLQEALSPLHGKLDVLSRRIDAVSACNPNAAVFLLPSAVALPDDVDSAVKNGDDATWTFVRHASGGLFAVGCAHCALYSRTLPDQFVHLPLCVARCGVVSVRFVTDPRSDVLFANPLATRLDVVAVELVDKASLPSAMKYDDLPVWAAGPTTSESFCSIGGRASSGIVAGEGQLTVNPADVEGIFVERAGEAGQSGTLLFGFRADGSHKLLGVYCGVAPRTGNGMHHRGRVALLPELDDMITVPVKKVSEPGALQVFDRAAYSQKLTVEAGVVYLGQWPGVVIHGSATWYNGSLDVGACRVK